MKSVSWKYVTIVSNVMFHFNKHISFEHNNVRFVNYISRIISVYIYDVICFEM